MHDTTYTRVHDHDHDHDHDHLFHTHAPAGKMKNAFWVTLLILVVEVCGGFLSNSLALLSDAGHVVTDLAAIGLSLYALNQGQRPPTERMTFGYHRTGIMAALVNAVSLIVIAVWVAWEAYLRLRHPTPVNSVGMFISAGVGLAANLYMGLGMRGSEDINVRSAVLHMLSDAAASGAVIVGGVVILFTRWYVVDPILSVCIALLVAAGAVKILQHTVGILMEATPKGIEPSKIADVIEHVQGVIGVHDLHIWSLAAGKHALSCHVVLEGNPTLQETQAIVKQIEHQLLHHNIGHATIQPEDRNHLHDDSLLCCTNSSPDSHVH